MRNNFLVLKQIRWPNIAQRVFDQPRKYFDYQTALRNEKQNLNDHEPDRTCQKP